MESTPICRCRVLYLGSAVPQQSKDGLQGIQEPLRELYPEKGAADVRGIDSWLSVWSNGILLENVDENRKKVTRFFPISSLHYCAAVRRVAVGERGAPPTARFLPLDSPFARAPAPAHPPLFAAILRRTHGIKVLECHAFVCKKEMAANALVRCCFHAYADSSYARQLDDTESGRAVTLDDDSPGDYGADDADGSGCDGDENHKVWAGSQDGLADETYDAYSPPSVTRAPRPRQISRPSSVPPPPPPEDNNKTKKSTSKRNKKLLGGSKEDLYPLMNGRGGPPPVQQMPQMMAPGWGPAGHQLLMVPRGASTLPHPKQKHKGNTFSHRSRGPPPPALIIPPTYMPLQPLPAVMMPRRRGEEPPYGGRVQYATVDPRRSKAPLAGLKAAQSMNGLDEAGSSSVSGDPGGIYRKKGHLNERAFSYSIRQEHRSRSHGSLANLKFAAPPEVDGGREELKKEREIMQLVAGLDLGGDEVERREVPAHVYRSRQPQNNHQVHVPTMHR